MQKTYELDIDGDHIEFDGDLNIIKYELYSEQFMDHFPINPELVKKWDNRYQDLLKKMDLHIAEIIYHEKYREYKKMEIA